MKSVKYLIMTTVLIVSAYSNSWAALKQLAKVHKVDKATQEVIVSSPRAIHDISMGDRLFVIIDNKPIIMKVSFPMMTVAKCTLEGAYRGYLNRIEAGMPVYKYRKGVENEISAKDSAFKKKTGNASMNIKATKKAMVFVMNHDDWDEMLRGILEKDGTTLPDKQRIVDISINAILNPDIKENEITLSMILYVLGNTGKNTPCDIDQLPGGNYYVWVVSDDMVSYQTISLGNREKKDVLFNIENRFLTVNSTPAGGDIYIDGVRQQQKTPAYSLKLSPAKTNFAVTVKKDGYEDSTQYVNVYQGEKKSLHFSLKSKSVSCLTSDYSDSKTIKYLGGHFGMTWHSSPMYYDSYYGTWEEGYGDVGFTFGVEGGIIGGNCIGYNIDLGGTWGFSEYGNDMYFGAAGLGGIWRDGEFFMYFGGGLVMATSDITDFGFGYFMKYAFGIGPFFYSIDVRHITGDNDTYAGVFGMALGYAW